jgi:endonuclease/exonuclease/phosphatase family metal-dependent hydrolase
MAMLTAGLSCLLTLAPTSTEGIVIDGRFDDWDDIAPTLVDPIDAPTAEADFGEIRIAHDDRYVHLLIELRRELNVQRLDGRIVLPLDVDGRVETGVTAHGLSGTDVIVTFSPRDPERPDRPGMGVGLSSPLHMPDPGAGIPPLSPYDVGIMLAPTYADDRIELRLDRFVRLPGSPPLFADQQFRGRLVLYDADDDVLDATEAFSHELEGDGADARDDQASSESDPLARPAGTELRIMSWNTRHGGLLLRRDGVLRVLRAVKPDVLLVQELTENQSAGEIAALLNEIDTESAMPQAAWSVIVGEGGGDLRCAVASRYALESSAPLRAIAFPERPDRTLRTAGAIVAVGDRRLLTVSVHLKCCGRIGDESDRTRELEARLLNESVRKAAEDDGIDGIVITGDLNLVGGHRPLELLAAGLDLDDSALDVVDAMQLDRRSNVTWCDPAMPFVPGRLDFALISGDTIEAIGGFVLDTADLPPAWLERHGLTAGDTDLISDHLPLIVDLHRRTGVD